MVIDMGRVIAACVVMVMGLAFSIKLGAIFLAIWQEEWREEHTVRYLALTIAITIGAVIATFIIAAIWLVSSTWIIVK